MKRLFIQVYGCRMNVRDAEENESRIDAVYRMGREILKAERQIKRGQVILWSQVKRRHRL